MTAHPSDGSVEASGRMTGQVLVVDEAGKTLEYAAQNPTRGDVHLFQALAELAGSFQDAPLVMVTVQPRF